MIEDGQWDDYLSAVWIHLQLHVELDDSDGVEAMVDAWMESTHLRLFSLLRLVQNAWRQS